MDWIRRLPRIASLGSFLFTVSLIQCQVRCLHIRPQPCQNSMGDFGTCMFVWECIKTEGKHLGTCADGFLFGSCCAHSDSKNDIIPSASDTTKDILQTTTTIVSSSKKPSSSFYSSTTSSPYNSFAQSSISHFPSKPYHFKPTSTTFRPIFTSPSNKPTSSSLKPVHIKTTSKPFFSTFKPLYTRPTYAPSSALNNSDNIRPSFKPSTSTKPVFIKPVSKPFFTTKRPEFIWSTSKLTSTTSRPVYIKSTHKTTTTFRPIFVRPTTKPSLPTVVYHPVETQPISSTGNVSVVVKTTNKPPLKSTTKKYGFMSSTHEWPRPTSFKPSYISTKQPWLPVRTSTTHQSPGDYWTSNNSFFRPSWKPTLKPTFMSSSTSNPFIYTYSTNNNVTRPSFTPFTRSSSPSSAMHFTTLSFKPSLSSVTTPVYSTDLMMTPEDMINVTLNENFFTTHRPFTSSGQTFNTKPYFSTTVDYFKPQSSNHGWFYPQQNKTPTVTLPTTSFFTTQGNNFPVSIVSALDSFINESTYRPSEVFTSNTFMITDPSDLSSEQVTLIGEKTTTPFPVSPCGTPRPHPKQKVVGGKNSAFGSWPWQASVRRTSFFGFSSTHRCGGALISRQWVATAGHCVDDLLIAQIKIRVGEYDFASIQEPHGYVERGIVKKVVHPRYNFFTYENDLALVKLEEAIDLIKHPHISPICLPPNEENLVGRNATVTGWGRLSEGGVLPSILQEVQVPIISNEKCKNMFLAAGRHEYIPDIFLCAGYEDGGRDSCQGDSGGPLQIKAKEGYWFLAGIISWGIGCAEPNMPGVCTRISKFKDWVVKQIT